MQAAGIRPRVLRGLDSPEGWFFFLLFFSVFQVRSHCFVSGGKNALLCVHRGSILCFVFSAAVIFRVEESTGRRVRCESATYRGHGFDDRQRRLSAAGEELSRLLVLVLLVGSPPRGRGDGVSSACIVQATLPSAPIYTHISIYIYTFLYIIHTELRSM